MPECGDCEEVVCGIIIALMQREIFEQKFTASGRGMRLLMDVAVTLWQYRIVMEGLGCVRLLGRKLMVGEGWNGAD